MLANRSQVSVARGRAGLRQVRRAAVMIGRVLLVMLAVLVTCATLLELQIVYTPSVPMGLYRRRPLDERPLAHGDYVCLEGWRPDAPAALRAAAIAGVVLKRWIESERLTKRVAGVPGDRVRYVDDASGGYVEINGKRLANSTALERDSAGVKLPKARYPRVLGADEYWLASEHPRGFDSRYFGPVSLRALGNRAELLWRW